MIRFYILIFSLFSYEANARVFDFAQQSFGTYFKGNIGTSTVGQSAYANASGSTTFSNSVLFNWGGEAGLTFTSKRIGFRIGYELISPNQQSGITGKDAAGNIQETLTSSIIGAFPVAHLDIFLSPSSTSRFMVSLGGGYGSVSLNNTYESFPGFGVAGYTEKGTATTYIAEISGGYEFSMSDNVTINLDLGYRLCPIANFTADNTYSDVYGRTIAKGSNLINADGSPISMTLNGYWLGVGFTFYFH